MNQPLFHVTEENEKGATLDYKWVIVQSRIQLLKLFLV
jgi:hypothetical protein